MSPYHPSVTNMSYKVLLGRIQAARHIIMAALKSYSLLVGARACCNATVTLGAVLANYRPCRTCVGHYRYGPIVC